MIRRPNEAASMLGHAVGTIENKALSAERIGAMSLAAFHLVNIFGKHNVSTDERPNSSVSEKERLPRAYCERWIRRVG